MFSVDLARTTAIRFGTAVMTVMAVAAISPSPSMAESPKLNEPAADKSARGLLSTEMDAGRNKRPLSLSEAIAMGVQNNLDVEVNRYAPYISELEAGASWGAYDPTFSGDAGWRLNKQVPINDNLLIADSETLDGRAGLQAMIPYLGATVGIDYEGAKQDGGSPFLQTFFPQYTASIGLTASVPLMKGLIWNQEWTKVKTSRLAYEGSLYEFSSSVMDTVSLIINTYWDLVAAKEQARVAEKSLERTTAQLEQTEIQYEVGVVSKVEVFEAEAGVARSEFDLIVAKNDYRNRQDDLIAVVLGDRLQASTTLSFEPTDNPEYTEVTAVNLDEAVGTAFRNRPDLAAAGVAIDQQEIQLKFAKNQRLPQLNAEMGYRTLGLSDTFGGTSDTFFGGPADATVRGVFSIPIPNTRARKNVSKARIELRRSNSMITRLKQDIIVEVRRAARGLLAAAQGVEAAERRRIAAAEQLRAERIRLEHGESTPFEVLQRERDLVEAESQQIAALQAFRQSQVKLERETGTILTARNVVIEQVRRLR
jgi:outer membrane protein TolC